jgi:ATP-dependent exoDNAse (exonuclease V) beta subunit
MPAPEDIISFGEQRSFADAARLLYVGITRARQGLIMSCSTSPTILLPDSPKLIQKIAI